MLQRWTLGFNSVNQTGGTGTNGIQRRFQFIQFLALAPPGDVAERIIRCVNAKMLTDHIRHTFGFDLARMLIFGQRIVFLTSVERSVG